MRCETVQRELSARMDAMGDPRLDESVRAHLSGCGDCRRFDTGARHLRRVARIEAAPPVPDLVAKIMDVATIPPPRALRAVRPLYRNALIATAGAAAVAFVLLAVSLRGGPVRPERTEALALIRTRTLLVWTPGRVSAELVGDLRALDGVDAVAPVRSGVAWLDGWTDTKGISHRPPRGFRVPVEVAAVDTATFGRFVPDEERAVLDRLDRGRIVLGSGGAAIRGIDGRGTLRFGPSAFDVAGIVDDELIGMHEAVVATSAAKALSIDRVRYVLVELGENTSPPIVQKRIERMATRDAPVRVRTLGETPRFRHGDAVLPPVRLKELFGEFAAAPRDGGDLRVDNGWRKQNISSQDVPVLGSVTCHTKIFPALRSALAEIARRNLASSVDPDDFGGCFAPRHLGQDEAAGISHHSWGIALDLNVSDNPFGGRPHIDSRVVEIFERVGFTWGGRWLVPDPMHFEFIGTVRKKL